MKTSNEEYNLYEAYFEETMGCGCCTGDSYDVIVGAVSKAEALGLVLEQYTSTRTHEWHINLLEVEYGEIYEI